MKFNIGDKVIVVRSCTCGCIYGMNWVGKVGEVENNYSVYIRLENGERVILDEWTRGMFEPFPTKTIEELL